ncbi:hypothetical protein BST61_g5463 [Cercospora zeina]
MGGYLFPELGWHNTTAHYLWSSNIEFARMFNTTRETRHAASILDSSLRALLDPPPKIPHTFPLQLYIAKAFGTGITIVENLQVAIWKCVQYVHVVETAFGEGIENREAKKWPFLVPR